ncbi:MAG: hypothetical protein LQ338_007883 [Usnochroma carphineum]|nr:MAG: hypothetical protein LQ338_007883 [Usnochroma carphineum]
MRISLAIPISLLLASASAAGLRLTDRKNDALEKRTPADRVVARQGNDIAGTSTIGILPNSAQLGTGIPSLGNHSLTGHGPAVRPQPDESNTETGPNPGTGTGTITGSGTVSGDSTGSDTTANDTTTATSPAFQPNPSSDPSPPHLEVIDYQYTYQSNPRVDITVKYGSNHVTQTWEVLNGRLHTVPAKGLNMTDSTGAMPCVPMGSGASNSSVNGTGSLEGSEFASNGPSNVAPSGTGEGPMTLPSRAPSSPLPSGTMGTGMMGSQTSGAFVGSGTGLPPPRQERPSGARPGFTGPKLRPRRREVIKGPEISDG